MTDTYPNFATLEQHERAGIDYGVFIRRAEPAFAIVAPHGGGIEPGTSEIADAIACQRWSFYSFEGLKRRGNSVLHITSTGFDEPMCLVLLGRTNRVVTIHGEESEDDGEGVFVGGLDEELGTSIGALLTASGFDIRRHPDPSLQGLDPKNICNRGASGAGVQLELSRAVRETLFESLTREGRKHPTPRFKIFVDAVARSLEEGERIEQIADRLGSGPVE
jgi:phage replication-related protein YjqB (UPF0714/DUF867 family)